MYGQQLTVVIGTDAGATSTTLDLRSPDQLWTRKVASLWCPQMTATTAYLAVLASLDGTTFAQLQDEAGNARKIAVSAAAGVPVELDSWFGRFPFLRFKAVAADGSTAVTQAATRTITAVLVAE